MGADSDTTEKGKGRMKCRWYQELSYISFYIVLISESWKCIAYYLKYIHLKGKKQQWLWHKANPTSNYFVLYLFSLFNCSLLVSPFLYPVFLYAKRQILIYILISHLLTQMQYIIHIPLCTFFSPLSNTYIGDCPSHKQPVFHPPQLHNILYRYFFNQCPTDGYLSCFQLFTIA